MASNDTLARRNFVLERLGENGRVSVSELQERFGVSAVTVRRDLDHLEARKLLVRTHGGAVANSRFVYDLPFEEKAVRHAAEKKRIGRRGAELVDDHDLIILDSGTTALQVFRHLRTKAGIKVATNSVLIAGEALRVPDLDVIVLGGTLRASSGSVTGPHAERMLRDYSFRKLFLAGDGFDVSFGLTTTDDHEAALNRGMIEAAEQTIVVVDSSKFGRRGLARICGLDAVDAVITDADAPDEAVATLRDRGIEVMLV